VSVLPWMLDNAAVAAVLAVFAAALSRFARAPAVRHAAWLLVPLKLVTPPLVSLPLPVLPASWAARLEAAPVGVEPLLVAGPAGPVTAAHGPSLTNIVLLTWTTGALVWFVWQGRRIVRFRRRVRAAGDAPADVQAAANRTAKALGMTRPPAVKLVTGVGSPMLWGWGRSAVILLPRDLLPRLAPEALDTLIAHELAHFLRRDHWVRVLEYVATGLYWWHPAVWLARAGIEAAEEECCDAWVVGGLAASPRRYAEALLATVDFEAELRRPCLPPAATAASRGARLLHRRLVRIIHADRAPRLPFRSVFRAIAAAVLLTQPVLITAAPVTLATSPASAAGAVTRTPRTAVAPNVWPAVKEPRAWATVTAPGGAYAVLAREHELILRHPNGTDRVLGPGRPYAVAFAPGATRLATGGPGPLVRSWDNQGTLIAETHGRATVRAVAYTPDGRSLLALDAAGGISVYDARTLARSTCWAVDGPANSIACDPDAQTVAVSFGSWLADDGWVERWSIPERRRLASYPAPAPVGASRFAPDGGTLVIGGWNGRTVWRALPSGALIAERLLSKQAVADAAFSPDAGTLPLDPPPDPTGPALPISPALSELLQRIGQLPER
jgi:YD repeat-containing protein